MDLTTPTQKKKRNVNFNIYIKKLLLQVHPDAGLNSSSLIIIDNIIKIIIGKIVQQSNLLMEQKERKTISSREIQTAIKLIFPTDLAMRAINNGTNAVVKYNSNIVNGIKGSKSHKSELIFPVTRIEKIMSKTLVANRKSDTSSVYLCAVCEFLVSEILGLAGTNAKLSKKVRITPRHIMLAINKNESLANLFANTVIGGGVVNEINPAILPLKK